MDPNATVADIVETNAALARGEITRDQHRAYVAARKRDLRAWRLNGGFPPAIGWSAALAL